MVRGKQPDLKLGNADASSDSARFELVVDENGKAVMSTARAISPTVTRAPEPRYREFVAQVSRQLPAFRFEPALVGTCPVRQILLQSFGS